jgi:hypothetical protein
MVEMMQKWQTHVELDDCVLVHLERVSGRMRKSSRILFAHFASRPLANNRPSSMQSRLSEEKAKMQPAQAADELYVQRLKVVEFVGRSHGHLW